MGQSLFFPRCQLLFSLPLNVPGVSVFCSVFNLFFNLFVIHFYFFN